MDQVLEVDNNSGDAAAPAVGGSGGDADDELARALAMAAGSKDASGMEDYEQLHVYAMEEDHAKTRADAAKEVASLQQHLSLESPPGSVYPAAGSAAAKTSADLSSAAGRCLQA